MSSNLLAYSPEFEIFAGGQAPSSGEAESGPLGGSQELEFAVELLEIRNERELDRFLAGLVRKTAAATGSTAMVPAGQAVSGILKTLVGKMLPLSGTGGQLGAKLGRGLVSVAGPVLGLELEGLSVEDREFGVSRQFVRLARVAIENTLGNPRAGRAPLPPRQAVIMAAREFAPGLLESAAPLRSSASGNDENQDGRWMRQGRRTDVPIGNQAPQSIHRTTQHYAEDTMHDIDRTQLEFNPEFEAFEFEQFEMPGEAEGVFSEAEVMELASELLEVRDEQEMDHFLGGLIKKAGSFLSSPQGKALGGVLKGMAKKALPIAGTAIGGFFGGPLGAKLGQSLGSMAGNVLKLEGEMSMEDREFEGAKAFVRVASSAARSAAAAPPSANPVAVAQKAVARAAQAYVPGLLRSAGQAAYPQACPTCGPTSYPASQGYASSTSTGVPGRSGRWYRRGGKVVLSGL